MEVLMNKNKFNYYNFQQALGKNGINFFDLDDEMWNQKNGHIMHFSLGNLKVQVENIENRYFRMYDVQFTFDSEGHLNVSWNGEQQYDTLDDLKNGIKNLRALYKKMLAFSKNIQADRDFV